jgi:hypothetical protein
MMGHHVTVAEFEKLQSRFPVVSVSVCPQGTNTKTLRAIKEMARCVIDLENAVDVLDLGLKAAGMYFKREQRFAIIRDRQFRFDFGNSDFFLAIEVEGGIWKRGRHTRPKGYIRDLEKYNLAAELGWTVLRYSSVQAFTLDCIPQIKRVYDAKRRSK